MIKTYDLDELRVEILSLHEIYCLRVDSVVCVSEFRTEKEDKWIDRWCGDNAHCELGRGAANTFESRPYLHSVLLRSVQ